MAKHAIDVPALEMLLIQALTASDRLGYDPVGAHLATALDALRREALRGERPAAPQPDGIPLAG